MDSVTWIQIIFLIVMLILSAIFSSAETAFTTVNRIQLQLLAEEKNKKAILTLRILDSSSKMLSTILICNNVVNLSASAMATTLTIRLFGNRFVALATGVLTLVLLIVGEILPKSLATVFSRNLSLAYAPFIWIMMKLLSPIIFIVEKIREKVLGLFPVEEITRQNAMTEDELKTLVDVGLEEGAIENDEFEMISNVFGLDESQAKDIMVPKADIVFLPIDISREEFLEIYRENAFTRYPIYNESTDTVIGTINIKDLIDYPEDEPFQIRKIMREPHFTFEHMEVGNLLIEMREQALSIIIVLDEYGTTSGLITLEDILEEIVGEIRDEYDDDERDSVRELKEDREFLVEGFTILEDVNEKTGLKLSSEEYDTIGGFIIEHLNRLPKKGEHIDLDDGTKLVAELVRKNRIEKVHIILPELEETKDEE